MLRVLFYILFSFYFVLSIFPTYHFFIVRPPWIRIEPDLTCETTRDPNALSEYILKKYGKDGDFNNINYALFSHGYYLRGTSDKKFQYISNGDGNVCSLWRFSIDTSVIILERDEIGKVVRLGRGE